LIYTERGVAPTTPSHFSTTALILGRALHAPWNEGTRVINRNFAEAARTLRPVRVVSLTHLTFKNDPGPAAAAGQTLPIQHVYSRAGYGLHGVYRGLPRLLQGLKLSDAGSPIGVAHLFGMPLSLGPWFQRQRIHVIDHIMVRPLRLRDRLLVRGSIRLWGRWVEAFALSSQTLMPLLQSWGVPESKLFVLPAAVDGTVFQPGPRDAARAELGLTGDRHLIVYIGRLSARRFPARLVREALQMAALSSNRPLHFVAVTPSQTFDGSPNSAAYLEECAKIVQQDLRNIPNVSVDIRTANLQDPQKLAWVRAADAVLLPFVAPEAVEPPITLLEAMASAATIIASPAANRSGLVQSGVNGFVFRSPDELAHILSQVTMGAAGGPSMGAAARQTVLATHSFDAVAAATARLWSRVETSSSNGTAGLG
jgi:glycosyltransferase involved in cell wall biosynthesis